MCMAASNSSNSVSLSTARTLSSRFRETFNADDLPQVVSGKGSLISAVPMMLFGLVFAGFPIAIIIANKNHGDFLPIILVGGLFALVGSIVFLLGINEACTVRHLRLSREEVSERYRSLFKRRSWTKPIGDYQGVLMGEFYRRSGKHTYRVYAVRLEHENSMYTITLQESSREDGLRSQWEKWAACLGMPAIEKDHDGNIEARSIDDLNVTVAERIRKGEIVAPELKSESAPHPFRMTCEDKRFTLTYPAQKVPFVTILVFLIIPGIFVGIGFFGKAPPIFGWAGLFFAAILLLLVVLPFITTHKIVFTPDEILVCSIVPWGEIAVEKLATKGIEQVSITTNAQQPNRKEIRLAGDHGQIKIGEGTTEVMREWLHAYTLRHLAQYDTSSAVRDDASA